MAKSLCSFIFIFILTISISALADDNYWLQLMPDQQSWVRIVTEKEQCPELTIDDKKYKTSLHSHKTPKIPTTSCKLVLPESAHNIKFDNHSIKVPTKDPQKIAIIGDTGCRMKGIYLQNCKKNWPFKKIADIAAQHNPDLVIHLGDYLYRESCKLPQCRGEPVGDNLQTWNADFFTPANKLLNTAPWVMVRGNHESCARSGNGWSHFFDYREKCYQHTKPYAVDISSDLRLIVADSAESDLSQEDLNEINALLAHKKSWLLTHKPLWFNKKSTMKTYIAPKTLSNNISTIFSGHIHFFQLSENSGKKQVIVGNGGTKLDKFGQNDFTKSDFGFAILDRQSDKNWKLDLFNVNNEVVASYFIE